MTIATLTLMTPTPVSILGPAIEHRDSLLAMLASEGASARWIPDSGTFKKQKGSRVSGLAARLGDNFFGTSDRSYMASVLKAIDESGTKLIVAYWGTIPLSDIQSIKHARPEVKIVLMVLCYPLSFTSMGILRQRMRMGRARSFIDGIICPTKEMVDYLENHDFSGRQIPMLELPPCWPTSYQSKRRASTISERPNVIYVGRTDLSGKTVHVADDVRPLMSQLLVAGIELHHGASKETDDGHPLRKPFDYRPVPELVAMMSGFDAGLVSYNATACKRTERLSLTVPDRLITTVAAGITVAIPKVGYAAAKTYLSKYPAVIQFGSAAELFEVLRERTYVAQLNEEAWLARPRYAAESHRENLRRFLNSIAGGLDLEGPNNLY